MTRRHAIGTRYTRRRSIPRHPLEGRYAFVTVCRAMDRGNLAGRFGGIIRQVDIGKRKGLAGLVLQRPYTLAASTLSGRCTGEVLRITDERELDTVLVVMPYGRQVTLRELLDQAAVTA